MLVEELIEWLGCWAPYLEIRQESRSSGGVGKGIAVKLIQGQGDSNHHCLHQGVSIHSRYYLYRVCFFFNLGKLSKHCKHSNVYTALIIGNCSIKNFAVLLQVYFNNISKNAFFIQMFPSVP